jgi:hypothetical protein
MITSGMFIEDLYVFFRMFDACTPSFWADDMNDYIDHETFFDERHNKMIYDQIVKDYNFKKLVTDEGVYIISNNGLVKHCQVLNGYVKRFVISDAVSGEIYFKRT